MASNLENQGIPVISIDAWRTDYLEDPLIAFVAAAEQRIVSKRARSETRIEKAKSISTGLAKYAGKLTPTLVSAFADSVAPGAGPVASAAAERAGEMVLNAINEKKDAEVKFGELLSTARDFLTGRSRGRPVKPIVVAIDELDRCRPSYAVKVLERIKHFFDVPGIVFVIATDGENLPNAVASVYGDKIDGEKYLRKFFDYEFDLSEPESEKFSKILASQFDFDRMIGFSSFFSDEEEARGICLSPSEMGYERVVSGFDRSFDAFEILASFPFFSRNLKLTLRDQSQAFSLINAYLLTLKNNVMIYPSVLVFAYCLRFSQPKVYAQLRSGELSLQRIFKQGPGNPPLVPGGFEWIDSTIYGLDLNYFWEAAQNPDPLGYVRNLRQNLSQDRNSRMERTVSADKLFFRINADGQLLTQFLPRAFKLADAFS